MLLPLPSNVASFLRWIFSPFNDTSSHLLRDSTKFPHYYIVFHVSQWPVSLYHIPIYRTKDKFYTSCIKQQWTIKHNFHTDMELHMPQTFYQVPYIPNREKYNKICKMCQVMLPLVSGVLGLSVSIRYDTAFKYWPWLVQHGTLIYHSQVVQPSWPTSPSSTLYLRIPAQTHVL